MLCKESRVQAKKSPKENTPKDKLVFDAQAFLDSAGLSRKVIQYRKSQKIYSQGAPATSVIYIQEGGVKLSVVNEVGKEAVVAILGPADFIGEGCLAGQEIRMGTATAIGPTAVLVIEKKRCCACSTRNIRSPIASWLTSFRETFESRRI